MSHPTGDGEPTEADIDALLDLAPHERATAIERIGERFPIRASGLRRWLSAIDASEGFLEHAATRPVPNRIGQRIGRWRVIGRLGEGGSGDVFRVTRDDHAYEQQGALKLLRPDQSIEEWQIAHERKLLARLDHPNIARLLDGGVSHDGRSFLVTEHIEGRTLAQWLDDARPSLARRVQVLLQVAEAVGSAHARLVVHGDLKPANLLVDATDRVRLIDFGVSRLIGGMADGPESGRALTPAWAAPEQLGGQAPTPQGDVYSLGLLLYFLLVGQLPESRRNDSLEALIERARGQPALRPSEDPGAGTNARLARGDLDAITFRCLQPAPADRYQDVRSLIIDLQAWQRGLPVSVRPWSPLESARRFVVRHWIASTLIALLVAAIIALALENSRLRAHMPVAFDPGQGVSDARRAAMQTTAVRLLPNPPPLCGRGGLVSPSPA